MSPAENDFDNVYKNLYTLLHNMTGGFISSSQKRAVFSLDFTSKSMVLIKNILTSFPPIGNDVSGVWG